MRANSRHTVSLNGPSYSKMRSKGRFGESFSELVLRLLDEIDKIKSEEVRNRD